jgi:hypothetical protein
MIFQNQLLFMDICRQEICIIPLNELSRTIPLPPVETSGDNAAATGDINRQKAGNRKGRKKSLTGLRDVIILKLKALC